MKHVASLLMTSSISGGIPRPGLLRQNVTHSTWLASGDIRSWARLAVSLARDCFSSSARTRHMTFVTEVSLQRTSRMFPPRVPVAPVSTSHGR
jgi:hypothetical protein